MWESELEEKSGERGGRVKLAAGSLRQGRCNLLITKLQHDRWASRRASLNKCKDEINAEQQPCSASWKLKHTCLTHAHTAKTRICTSQRNKELLNTCLCLRGCRIHFQNYRARLAHYTSTPALHCRQHMRRTNEAQQRRKNDKKQLRVRQSPTRCHPSPQLCSSAASQPAEGLPASGKIKGAG